MDIRTQHNFSESLSLYALQPLKRDVLRDLQINLGYLCNQACEHCHVEAGPKRTEIMSWDTMEKILKWIKQTGVELVDLTGGAPEMNPHFKPFVEALLSQDIHVLSRCNLTILEEPEHEELAAWYAKNKIQLFSSLPCYSKNNVESQRGKGVYDKSISALIKLNQLGYGRDKNLVLNLVYNPGGAFLPPDQKKLEQDYKNRLMQDFGIIFNQLLTITNLPIKRFSHYLKRTDQWDDYLALLVNNFNPDTVKNLMCKTLISVDWQGYVHDCDFNQMLNIPIAGKQPRLLWEIDHTSLPDTPITVASHCYGCTAGAGSSCGGAIEQ